MVEYTKIELEIELRDTVSVETMYFKCVRCLKFKLALFFLAVEYFGDAAFRSKPFSQYLVE